MQFGSNAVKICKYFEDNAGFRTGICSKLKAYRCPAGFWTAGYGHTAGVGPTTVIDNQTAELWINSDLSSVASHLSAILPPSVALNQNQFDALCSLCFNLKGGANRLPHLAPHLWNDLLDGKMEIAANEFLDMDHALIDGESVELPGLKKRRLVESTMFLGGDWEALLD